MRALSRRGVIAAGLAGAAMPAIAAPSPDAGLIAACAEHAANAEAYNRGGLLVPADEDPLWHAYERTRDFISAARPATMTGVLAKARAAKAEAMGPEGEEAWDHGPASEWAAQIVADLLRLSGVGGEAH